MPLRGGLGGIPKFQNFGGRSIPLDASEGGAKIARQEVGNLRCLFSYILHWWILLLSWSMQGGRGGICGYLLGLALPPGSLGLPSWGFEWVASQVPLPPLAPWGFSPQVCPTKTL